MTADIENRLRRFRDRLVELDLGERFDAVQNEVIENGGTYARSREPWPAPCLYEMTLHGITAHGAGELDAISNWIKGADRLLGAADQAEGDVA
nr:hypothetical protein [uncultured Celeribacter sp.]